MIHHIGVFPGVGGYIIDFNILQRTCWILFVIAMGIFKVLI